MNKFQKICSDTLEEGLKFDTLYFMCMSTVSSINMMAKNHCQFYIF